jgi:hypothetical protein
MVAWLLGLWKASTSWWEHMAEEAAHLMVTGKQNREEGEARVPISPSRSHSQ